MSTAQVCFNIPADLVQTIKAPSDYGFQSFVLGLYLDEQISFGKAAKLLNMTYDDFLDFLGQRRIPYFRETPDEIRDAMQKLDAI